MKEVIDLIKKDRVAKSKSKIGVKYYAGEHDILDHKLFYVNSNGQIVEDKHAVNIRIPHLFHKELVDQKVQYLLSNPIEVKTDDLELESYLSDYINEDFQALLQEALTGASNKGKEFIYAYRSKDDKLKFQVVDSMNIIEERDRDGNLVKIIRYYDESKNGKVKVEIWDSEKVVYMEIKDGSILPDYSKDMVVRPHVLLEDDRHIYKGEGIGRVPFFKLRNNPSETTDLEPIKHLIDDYDLMAASLSNNLEEFQDAIYVIKGYYGGEDDSGLDELARNIKTRKRVGVSDDGEFDIKTISIPYEARKVKLELDKEAIYKFGMGFDSTQIGDGNITNVVIKSRYSLLDLKCNKAEIHLRQLLRELITVIVEDINRRFDKSFNPKDVEFDIIRSTIVNENDIYTNEKIKAETKATEIGNILTVAPRLSDDTVLQLLCEVIGVDSTDEIAKLRDEYE